MIWRHTGDRNEGSAVTIEEAVDPEAMQDAILGPLALYLMIEALKGIRQALDYMFDTQMVRDENMAAIPERLSAAAWLAGMEASAERR